MTTTATLQTMVTPRRTADSAAPHLICIPYAGGNVRAFRHWPTRLHGAQVHIVELAGRGRNTALPLPRSITDVSDDLVRRIDSLPPADVAIFGHSLGALIGFELAVRLEGIGRPVRRLFASGCRAPGTPREAHHELSDPAFLNLLQGLGATPREFFQSPELLEFFLPVLRSDFRLAATYRPTADAAVSCPVDALFGHDDGDDPRRAADGWRERARTGFTVTGFPGDHFFMHQSETAVLQHIAAALDILPIDFQDTF